MGKGKDIKKNTGTTQTKVLFEKMEAAAKDCKHLKHLRGALKELKDHQKLDKFVYKQPKTTNSAIQLDGDKQLSKLVSNAKSQAALAALEAGDYIRKTKNKETATFFENLAILLNAFAKLHNEEFINKKEQLLEVFC